MEGDTQKVIPMSRSPLTSREEIKVVWPPQQRHSIKYLRIIHICHFGGTDFISKGFLGHTHPLLS